MSSVRTGVHRPRRSRPGRAARFGRIGRLVAAFWLAAAVVLGTLVVGAPRALAADAQIDSYAIDYTMQTSGVLQVKETIVYRFGDNSGRHGIDRVIVTREPDAGANADKDIVYGISNFRATSPDSGVNTDVSKSTDSSQGGREVDTTYRIGSANQTVDAQTATYVLTYDVAGAMRTSGSYDEFYWDATGFGWKEPIDRATVTAKVPGSPQGTECYAGPPRSTTACDSKSATGTSPATFSQSSIQPGAGLTVAVKITAGLIADNTPQLEPDASQLSSGQKAGVAAVGGVGLLSLVGSPIAGVLWFRKRGRDLRYLDVPPGTIAGEGARVGYSPRGIEIPVAFTPPNISVGEAGLLVDGQVDTRETAATLIDLAVRGAIRIDDLGNEEYGVQLLDPGRTAAPHEKVLLDGIFHGAGPGAAERLSSRGGLHDAHTAMAQSVRNEVSARGWFSTVPSGRAAKGVGLIGVVAVGFILWHIAPALVFLLLLGLPVVITVAVVRAKLRRGQRTPLGRAVCDQVDGFKTYLATAEAKQLRFEEGEDIFSKYLPWAIAFDLADRWAKICGELVEMGRLPDRQPYWYGGTGFNFYAFNTGFLAGSLSNSIAPPPPSSGGGGFGGTGFGSGGSAFGGGGGFSGGGGGGGGGGGW